MTKNHNLEIIDIHTHILPNIDDGASDMEEALNIVKRGLQEGIGTFVMTPHVREEADWQRLGHMRETFSRFNEECLNRAIGASLALGAEVFLCPDLPERLKEGNVCINGGKHVLVELPFSQLPLYAESVLTRLVIKGFVPIIAHLERYRYLRGKQDVIRRWKDNGIMFQMNAGSLSGRYGLRTKWFAKKLLAEGFIHFLASDAHREDDFCYFRKEFELITTKYRTIRENMESFGTKLSENKGLL